MPLSKQKNGLLIQGKITDRWSADDGSPTEFHMAYLDGPVCPLGIVVALIGERTYPGLDVTMVSAYQAPDWQRCLYWGNDIIEAHRVIWEYVEPRIDSLLYDPRQMNVAGSPREVLGLNDNHQACSSMGP